MAIVTVGIDLAKNVFALHGVDEAGAPRLKQPKVARGKLNVEERIVCEFERMIG